MAQKKKVKLTTRGRHAVMAMVEIATLSREAPVPLSHVAKAGDISLSYLEQLFSGLRRHGLVKSFRGPGGGYILAKPARDILVSDILISAEDCAPAKRLAAGSDETGNLETEALWSRIGEILYACLQHVSLADVVEGGLTDHKALNKLFETLA